MLSDVVNYIVAWVVDIFNHIIEWVVGVVDSIAAPIVSAIPDLYTDLGFLSNALFIANKFFAFDYALLLFSSYIVFCFSLSLVNWILGLIPGIN